ncbi:WRKY domain [Dillenia turbinata]|uniref:WRKY domain n=1 Tax=Dillenia turbinata TaxID=194707 RepID=A0AAN8VYX7_9MAGN
MECSWPENLPPNKRKLIVELVRGREFTNQLKNLLNNPAMNNNDDGSDVAGDLVAKILTSFSETLSVLSTNESDEVVKTSPSWEDARKSEDSGESCKSSALKDRRGCYKRRKTTDTCTKVTRNLTDDGYAWRKYGQKVILNAKYPRNYYRCTHKIDQGCQATKQVQRTDDEPPMFRTTYSGYHTCKNLLKAPQIILDSDPRDSATLLSFDTNDQQHHDSTGIFASLRSTSTSIKHESRDEEIPGPYPTHNHRSSDYLVSPELTTFESSGPATSTLSGSDRGDVMSEVYSCTASTHSMDMDLAFHFDDLPQFINF